MEFTPINTQEEFNEKIQERLQREAKKYESYTSPEKLEEIKQSHSKEIDKLNTSISELNEKLKNKDKEIADRDAKIKSYETASVKTRIAHELGLPYDAADFLRGETEDDIKKSAESLKGLVGKGSYTPPLAGSEKPVGGSTDAALSTLLGSLVGQNE